MTREELVNLLTVLVGTDKITLSEAAEILADFDDGEIDPEELPLLEEEAGIDAADAAAGALIWLLLILGGSDEAEGLRRLGTFTPAEREAVMDALTDGMDSDAGRIADELARTGDVRAWHDAAKVDVENDLFGKAALGKGAPLTPEEIEALRPIADEQAARLKRFADEVAARKLAGRPMSEAEVSARLRMYAGAGRAEFWRFTSAGYGEGYTVRFVSRDDPSTCSPCLAAEEGSPYLPGRSPLPGVVCQGGGHCRCVLEYAYSPEEAERLRGETVSA